MYNTYTTKYEELSFTLDNLPEDEDLVTIVVAGTDFVIVTKKKEDKKSKKKRLTE